MEKKAYRIELSPVTTQQFPEKNAMEHFIMGDGTNVAESAF